jgi:hypothetical protein
LVTRNKDATLSFVIKTARTYDPDPTHSVHPPHEFKIGTAIIIRSVRRLAKKCVFLYFCYKPSVFQPSKMFGFDFHTYLNDMMVSKW